ncbi:hypothetical protein ABK040_008763 [Willaertia magna]
MTSSTDSSSLHKKQQQQTIYVTGEFSNDYCSFTNITFPHKIHSSSAGSFHSGIVTESGDLYMMGINTEGQVGLKDVNELLTFTRIENLKNVKNIYCGNEFTFILVENLQNSLQNSLQQSKNVNLELYAHLVQLKLVQQFCEGDKNHKQCLKKEENKKTISKSIELRRIKSSTVLLQDYLCSSTMLSF